MELVSSFGLMDLDMKGSGRTTKPMEKEESFMLMVIFMMENGLMIRHMDLESL